MIYKEQGIIRSMEVYIVIMKYKKYLIFCQDDKVLSNINGILFPLEKSDMPEN